MQTSAFLADLAHLARLSVPTLSEQQAETRAAAAFLLLVGHPSPAEVPDISLAHYLEALQASSSQR